MSLVQSIPELSAFFHQPSSLGLVQQAAESGIDLFSIWKFCAIAVSSAKIIDLLFLILSYFVDTKYTDDEKILGSVFSGIAILFQIPYINLSFKEDMYEFANDGLSQFVIILDLIGLVLGWVLGLFVPSA